MDESSDSNSRLFSVPVQHLVSQRVGVANLRRIDTSQPLVSYCQPDSLKGLAPVARPRRAQGMRTKTHLTGQLKSSAGGMHMNGPPKPSSVRRPEAEPATPEPVFSTGSLFGDELDKQTATVVDVEHPLLAPLMKNAGRIIEALPHSHQGNLAFALSRIVQSGGQRSVCAEQLLSMLKDMLRTPVPSQLTGELDTRLKRFLKQFLSEACSLESAAASPYVRKLEEGSSKSIAQLEGKVGQYSSMLEKQREITQKYKTRVEELKTGLHKGTEQQKQDEEFIIKLSKEVGQLRRSLTLAETKVKSLEEEQKERVTLQDYQALMEKHAKAESSLREVTSDLASLKKQVAKDEARRSAAAKVSERELHELVAAVKARDTKISGLSQDYKAAHERIEWLDKSVSDSSATVSHLLAAKEELERKLETEAACRKGLMKKNAHSLQEVRNAKYEASKLRKELTDLKRKLADAEQKLADAEQKQETAQADSHESPRANLSSDRRVSTPKFYIAKLKSQLSKAESDLDRLRAENTGDSH